MQRIIRVCFSAAAMLPTLGFASELHLYLGSSKAVPYSTTTYSWALEYRRPLSTHLSGSFAWLNEGHVPGHHRDGQAVQLWLHTAPADRAARLEIGIGPYRHFDTVEVANADGYANLHGWGVITSAGVVWRVRDGWLASLRINRVHHSISSTAVVAGLGYRFGPADNTGSGAKDAHLERDSYRSELDLMMGKTIVNSFDADSDTAKAVAWRARVAGHLVGSLTYLDEGNVRSGRRAGLAPQIWLEDSLTNRFSVGAGLGPYIATRRPLRLDGTRAPAVSALISLSAAYAIGARWTGRMTWNRVETSYDRDSDVLMFALGYRF